MKLFEGIIRVVDLETTGFPPDAEPVEAERRRAEPAGEAVR